MGVKTLGIRDSVYAVRPFSLDSIRVVSTDDRGEAQLQINGNFAGLKEAKISLQRQSAGEYPCLVNFADKHFLTCTTHVSASGKFILKKLLKS